MPEPPVDEETLVRNYSLCLYKTQGISSAINRRCDNCPGPARSPQYHQLRCPFDKCNEFNLFNETAAPQAGKSDGPKSLASSSDAVVSNRNHDISLDESRSASGLLVRLNISGPPTARSVSDPTVGRKRKADLWPESSSRNELDDPQGEEDFHTQKPYHRLKTLEDFHSLSISSKQPEGLLRREQASAVSVITAESNESTRVSGDHADRLSNVREDLLSNVREDLRNMPERIFEDNLYEKPVLMDGNCGINASSWELNLQSLMYEEEILGPSEEEQRNE